MPWEAKNLWGLNEPENRTIDGAHDVPAGIHLLHCVGHRQCGYGGTVRLRRGQSASDQARSGEGTGRVVNEHEFGIGSRKRL